ncbi:MAG: cation-translocating P-type ATPase, partial [Chlamydiota bacterium]|nr:cation-translocating P-type ATPase [Chlamydiota bacterium]
MTVSNFDAFLMGQEESLSPFLTDKGKRWARYLPLKVALVSLVLLVVAFAMQWVAPAFSLPFLLGVYCLAGIPACIESIEEISRGVINIDVLMTLAAFLSFSIGSGMEGGLLLVLFSLAEGMEGMVSQRAEGALRHLHALCPSFAHLIDEEGHLIQKAVKDIQKGSSLLIKAGEVVPLDGRVVRGSSFVNLSHITGEDLPVSKEPGDGVVAGSRNLDGSLTIEVTKRADDSTLNQIIELMKKAKEGKPRIQSFLDRFSQGYATAIIMCAALAACLMPLLMGIPFIGLGGSLYRALAFLVAASPCALIIATPTAYLSAMSACSKKGILVKGGKYLDALSRCRHIAFDKTGTLSSGHLDFLGVEVLAGEMGEEEALSLAASIEQHALHPMAEAICRYARNKEIPLCEVVDSQILPGKGIEGHVLWKGGVQHLRLGSATYIQPEEGLAVNEEMAAFMSMGEFLCKLSFRGTLRKGVQGMLKRLIYWEKKKVMMLTGDHPESAHSMAQILKIPYQSHLTPEEKFQIVDDLAKQGGLAMVGDGLNDAPALARSTVGIAMGK